MTHEEALAYVDSFSRSGAPVKDLSRIAGLMKRLGDPQKQLRFIHIAGTNGKGSVAEYLTNILMESGFCTGTFTSPYILCYEDRIRLNRENIQESALCSICEQVASEVSGDEGFSQFEITFAIAMLYYIRYGAEIVVLETGMGGALDCTNVIDPPLVSIITSVSPDHMAILGNTIDEIAAQKAGIIKQGSPAVWCPVGRAKPDVFVKRADALGCRLYWKEFYEETRILEESIFGSCFVYHNIEYRIRMGGAHQIDNAKTAVITAEVLRKQGIAVSDEAVQRGLARTQVPGRMQIIEDEPLIILDGGHNQDGIASLCHALQDEEKKRKERGANGIFPCIAVMGMTHGDAVKSAAKQLSGIAESIFCVDGFAPNTIPAETLAAACAAQMCSKSVQVMQIEKALDAAKKWAGDNHGTMLICGSLYLASWYLNRRKEA